MYEDAERLQTRLESYKMRHLEVVHGINEYEAHDVFNNILQLETSFEESSAIFRDLDDAHSGFVHVDKIAQAAVVKANSMCKAYYHQAVDALNQSGGVTAPGKRNSTGGASRLAHVSVVAMAEATEGVEMVDHLRDKLVEQVRLPRAATFIFLPDNFPVPCGSGRACDRALPEVGREWRW